MKWDNDAIIIPKRLLQVLKIFGLQLGDLVGKTTSLLCILNGLELRQPLSLGLLPEPLLFDLLLHELDAPHKACLLLCKGRSRD